jgi:hypothetical protein
MDARKDGLGWVERNYPSHAYETERVQVRENSPRGARRGEWRKYLPRLAPFPILTYHSGLPLPLFQLSGHD